MAAMEERIIVSGGDGVRVFMPPEREPLQQIRLEGAGALCARKECVFCASDWGNTVWRLDAQTLVPTGLFAGGPDMRRLLLSADGARLLILCAEADSVLLLDAASGAPLVLTRAGVNPQNMALDESGEVLAVAAGESGEVLLLLHGNGESGAYFVHQLAHFEDRYRVIAVDTRGSVLSCGFSPI